MKSLKSPSQNKRWLSGVVIVGALLLLPSTAHAEGFAKDLANRIYKKMTGTPLLDQALSDQMSDLISRGQRKEAALLAAEAAAFSNVRMRNFSHQFFDGSHNPNPRMGTNDVHALNDGIATMIVMARDGVDFRRVLDGDQIAIGNVGTAVNRRNNDHYEDIDDARLDLNNPANLFLVNQTSTQYRPDFTEVSGLMTSQSWGFAHLFMGTNRRATERSLQEFLCMPMENLADGSVPSNWIRRDVDRSPGGNSKVFLEACKNCHSGMDALGGAWAYWDLDDEDEVLHTPGSVVAKMNRNDDVYELGAETRDDSWVNHFNKNANASLGWRGPQSGRGVKSYATMLANSKGFSQCMAKRVFEEVCVRQPNQYEQGLIETLGQKFEDSGYKMKHLFADTIVTPNCLDPK